jgi:hypothetical protein
MGTMSTVRNAYTRLLCSAIVAGTLGCATPASADVVTDWNALAVGFINQATPLRPPPFPPVDLAVMHIAIHDAVQAYQHRFKTYNAPIPGASGSVVAAVAKAAHDVLVSRFQIPAPMPGLIAQVDTAYTNYLISKGLPVNDPGVAVGQQAALNAILNRANDGAFPANPEVFTGSTEPGQWRPTPPLLLPMAAPWMGNVTPFAQKDTDGLLHEPPPPHLTSGLYTRDYNEVKKWGARTGSARTPEQTTFARFYSGNFVIILQGVLRTVSLARVTDIGDSARLFALANISGADSLINVWNNKRLYNIWRPSTAINNGNDDGNPRTEGDPAWRPLIDDPPYPDYTSGANGVTGATMRALENFFGDDVWTFIATTNALEGGLPIAPRTYHSFSAMAADVVEARILLGIHFRFADAVARRQGYQSADRAFARVLQPLK